MASRKGEFGEPVVLDVEGFDVRVSSPQRVYFAARGETKLDLVNYYLSVGDGIVRALESTGADLIVMGSHGRRGLEKLVLGSVTQRVLGLVHVPVLVVRD